MPKSAPVLTVVLPIHNAEATIRRSVEHVLEVAAELTPSFELVIVDDGSTDDTYDVASEISVRLPQVHVVRQAHQRGLGAAIKRVKKIVQSELVMVHDGVSRMDAEQLRTLWNRRDDTSHQTHGASVTDLLRPKRNQRAMEAAHARLLSFQLLNGAPAGGLEADTARVDALHAPEQTTQPKSVGAIPPLPRANIAGIVSNFALGE